MLPVQRRALGEEVLNAPQPALIRNALDSKSRKGLCCSSEALARLGKGMKQFFFAAV